MEPQNPQPLIQKVQALKCKNFCIVMHINFPILAYQAKKLIACLLFQYCNGGKAHGTKQVCTSTIYKFSLHD